MLPTAFTHKPLLLWEQWPCTVHEVPGHVIAATTLAGVPVYYHVRMLADRMVHKLLPDVVFPLPSNVVILRQPVRLAAVREAVS